MPVVQFHVGEQKSAHARRLDEKNRTAPNQADPTAKSVSHVEKHNTTEQSFRIPTWVWSFVSRSIYRFSALAIESALRANPAPAVPVVNMLWVIAGSG
jgi:hypothetical protein